MGLHHWMPFYVTTTDSGGSTRDLAEFRNKSVAVDAARRSLKRGHSVLATVYTREGRMVFAVDGEKEWEGGEAMA